MNATQTLAQWMATGPHGKSSPNVRGHVGLASRFGRGCVTTHLLLEEGQTAWDLTLKLFHAMRRTALT